MNELTTLIMNHLADPNNNGDYELQISGDELRELWARICEVIRERNEARAEAARLREKLAELYSIERELDEARAEAARLRETATKKDPELRK